MTMSRLKLILFPAVVFVVALAVLGAVNRSEDPGARERATPEAERQPRTLDERIVGLQDAIRSAGRGPAPYTELGLAFLQKARNTADPGSYGRAEQALERAVARDGRDAEALAGLGELAAARHDFHAALRHARAARPRARSPRTGRWSTRSSSSAATTRPATRYSAWWTSSPTWRASVAGRALTETPTGGENLHRRLGGRSVMVPSATSAANATVSLRVG